MSLAGEKRRPPYRSAPMIDTSIHDCIYIQVIIL